MDSANLSTSMETPRFEISIVMLSCSCCCVITSVLLFIGVCVESRMLLIPYISSVSLTTVVDLIVSFYLLLEEELGTFLFILIAIEFFIFALTVYGLLCVLSKYQQIMAGRDYPVARENQPPPEIEMDSTVGTTQDPEATHSNRSPVISGP